MSGAEACIWVLGKAKSGTDVHECMTMSAVKAFEKMGLSFSDFLTYWDSIPMPNASTADVISEYGLELQSVFPIYVVLFKVTHIFIANKP